MQEDRNFKNKGIPKSWQDKRILRYLRKFYQGKKRRTAFTIYLILTELASDKNQLSTFMAAQETIAKMSGASYSTVRRYLNDFVKIKILSKKHIKNGKHNYANKWALLEYAPMTMAAAKVTPPIHNNEQTQSK